MRFETHWLLCINESDNGWDTFMENAEVLYVTLFTPGPSNTALFEGYMVKIVERCGRDHRMNVFTKTPKISENTTPINAQDLVERHNHYTQSVH